MSMHTHSAGPLDCAVHGIHRLIQRLPGIGRACQPGRMGEKMTAGNVIMASRPSDRRPKRYLPTAVARCPVAAWPVRALERNVRNEDRVAPERISTPRSGLSKA